MAFDLVNNYVNDCKIKTKMVSYEQKNLYNPKPFIFRVIPIQQVKRDLQYLILKLLSNSFDHFN